MAVLPDADRALLWADLMHDLSASGEACGVAKADLRAALDAADAWADSVAGNFNAALPQPARGALTARQKARLLTAVIRRRFELS